MKDSNNPIEDIYPLSPMQQGMLFYSQLNQDARLYFEQLSCKVIGMVNLNAFKQAWKSVIDDNPILRTVFDWEGGKPVQIVLRHVPFQFEYEDIRSNKQSKKYLKIDSVKDIQNRFDLQKGPLMRFKLIHLKENIYIFRISYHHIILDGGSIPIIFNDFKKCYDNIIKGKKPIKTDRRAYKEFIRWLKDQDKNEAKRYWKNFLEGYDNENSLFVNSSLLNQSKSEANVDKVVIPPRTVDKLIVFTRNSHITISSALQCIWSLILYKSTRINDLIYGLTLANRPSDIRGSEQMLGLFINTVPMRIKINSASNFVSLSKQIQNNWAEMQEYSYLSLSEIKRVANLRIIGDPFQSIFVYSDRPLVTEPRNTKSPLEFSVYSSRELTNYRYAVDVTFDNELTFQISCPSELVQSKDVKRMTNEFAKLLEKCLNFPDEPLHVLFNDTKIRGKVMQDTSFLGTNGIVEKSIPRSNVNKKILSDVKDVWKKVLGIKDISDSDNFFELGGDSISSLRICAELVQKNYDLSLKDIFNNPTVLSLASTIRLKNKEPVIKTNLKVDNQKRLEIEGDHGSNIERLIPVSYIQESILDDCFSNSEILYHDQSYFEYKGNINYSFFEKAWNRVILENSALRSTFYKNKNKFIQCILKRFDIKLKFKNLVDLDKKEQKKEIESYLEEDLNNKFNLEKQPPLRICLFRLSENKHVFLLSFNVVIFDGWCFAFVMNDFFRHYKSLITNGVYEIHREPFENYIFWLQKQNLGKALGYWKKYLRNFHLKNYVKRRRLKNSKVIYKIGSLKIDLKQPLLNSLRTISKQKRVTISSIFQTLWAYSLHRLSSEKYIFIGITVSGRPPSLKGSDHIIGTFFNDLPVSFKFSQNNNLLDIIRKNQEELSSALNFDFVAPKQIKKVLKMDDKDELFQTLFIFENYPRAEENYLKSRKKDVLVELKNWRRESTNIDINVYIELEDQPSIEIKYIKELFLKSDIEDLLACYEKNLSEFAKSQR